LGAFGDSHAAIGKQSIAHAIGGSRAGKLRHFGTVWSFSYGKMKKSAAVGRKYAIFLALWLF
jgi:hypothetical protein